MALKIIPSSSSYSVLSLFLLCASFLIILCSSGFPRSACGSSFTEPHATASTTTTLGNHADVQSLLAFKEGIISDPFGALNSWNHSIHFCQWFGVTCGRHHRQRVTELKLDDLELKGSISPHIGNLSFLRILMLRNNSFGQKIPPEVGRLRRLEYMSLWSNSIVGEIPANISSCSNLVVLELTRNNLGGTIPSTLGNLSSLRIFYAGENNIGGSIPNELGRLKNLEYFGVGFNNLVGTIPWSIWNISSITVFYVANNHIGGILPSELGGIIFPRIIRLYVFQNAFTGTIPVSISNASYLEHLEMNSNMLTGDVPPMEQLVRLRKLELSDNSLGNGGKLLNHDLSFLSSLTNSANLEYIELFDNTPMTIH